MANIKNNLKKILLPIIILIMFFTSVIDISASPLITGAKGSSIFKQESKLPIIMYHRITYDIRNKWCITPEEFEGDLKYLQENGYTTVVMSDVIKYVKKGKKFPKKPIVLTFDDGDTSVYTYAYPLLKKYKMKAVLSIMGKITDDYSADDPDNEKKYPHLKWAQINEMVKDGCIELQNHSYNLHHSIGAKKKKNESLKDYTVRLEKDLCFLQDRILEMTKKKATTFTYPFGALNDCSDDVLKELGFTASLGCYDKVNTVTVDKPDCLFSLGRILRPPGTSSENFFKKIDKVFEQKEESTT